ncbi:hypothetical protein J4E86_011124 [Alternaria arbusti]|uniref:uncharacterized protein n=1 Tax=Alternaria arbusti TaxID=232088 RepID=UPI00221FED8D|nr:uncharacterized protein J4E86_011124 [Alternaria arbusti]KAI4940158.1 hypothetical protein J4E86_011124 [Alternaria arbusti]
MASKKYAFWNGFPFMTAPRTNYYSAQLQSSLFRLPREVRDVIYAYYVTGDDGYHYDSGTGKMFYTTEPRQTVFDLLQHEDFLDLYTRYPSVKAWFREPLQQSVAEQADLLLASEGPGDEGELAAGAFDKALQYALLCARKRNGPEFARLAGETFGVRLCPIDRLPGESQMNKFVEGALHDVYSWEPDPWAMPDDDELAKLENLVCFPSDTDTDLPMTDEGIFYFPERRIDLFNNLLPEGFIWFDTFDPNVEFDWLRPTECFWVLIPWIEEAYNLLSCGMPLHSFSLVIDGSTREISEIWKLIKYAAATQEARLEQYRLLKEDPPPRSHTLDYYFWLALPTNFAKMIREIIEGSSVVKFEGDVGEPWDSDAFLFERKDWSDEQWDQDWIDNIVCYGISSNRFRQAANRYAIKPYALRTTRRFVRHGEGDPNDTQSGV